MPQHASEIEGLALVYEDPGLHKYPVHTHDGYSIIGLTTGAKWFDICGVRVQVTAPALAVANPGDPHGCEPVDSPWAHRTWYVSVPLMAEIAGVDAGSPVRWSGSSIADPDLAKRLQNVHEAYATTSPLERQSDALSALQTLVQTYANASSDAPETDVSLAGKRVANYEDLLLANLSGTSVDLETLAQNGGVHVNQVIRDFKKVHGITPGEFLRMKRLQLAKQVLNDGASLTEAAMEAGFADQSHFTRMFRRAYGMTPSAYRRLGADGVRHNPL